MPLKKCPECHQMTLDYEPSRRVQVCLRAAQCGYASDPEPTPEERICKLEDDLDRARKGFQGEQGLHRRTAWELEHVKDDLVTAQDAAEGERRAWLEMVDENQRLRGVLNHRVKHAYRVRTERLAQLLDTGNYDFDPAQKAHITWELEVRAALGGGAGSAYPRALEPLRWHGGMREHTPNLCWCYTEGDKGEESLCILKRGHHERVHEPVRATYSGGI